LRKKNVLGRIKKNYGQSRAPRNRWRAGTRGRGSIGYVCGESQDGEGVDLGEIPSIEHNQECYFGTNNTNKQLIWRLVVWTILKYPPLAG